MSVSFNSRSLGKLAEVSPVVYQRQHLEKIRQFQLVLCTLQVDACKEKYMNFVLEGGKKIVLDAEQARRDGPTVLRQHGIVFDRSVDLRLATNHALTAAEVIPGATPERLYHQCPHLCSRFLHVAASGLHHFRAALNTGFHCSTVAATAHELIHALHGSQSHDTWQQTCTKDKQEYSRGTEKEARLNQFAFFADSETSVLQEEAGKRDTSAAPGSEL